jgi:hypothetical protein
MVTLIAFHVLMLLLGLSIGTGILRVELVSSMLGYLHNTIGITAPPMQHAKTIALIWIGALVVIVDGCIALLLLVLQMSHAG